MTKEETLTYLKAYLDGDTAIGNIIPLRSVLESALEYLEHSLPSNLDEAAEDYGKKHKFLPDEWTSLDEIGHIISKAFKAGAEWMAGQGVTKEAVIGMATEEISIYVSRETLNELDLCPGDKVIFQIRNK